MSTEMRACNRAPARSRCGLTARTHRLLVSARVVVLGLRTCGGVELTRWPHVNASDTGPAPSSASTARVSHGLSAAGPAPKSAGPSGAASDSGTGGPGSGSMATTAAYAICSMRAAALGASMLSDSLRITSTA